MNEVFEVKTPLGIERFVRVEGALARLADWAMERVERRRAAREAKDRLDRLREETRPQWDETKLHLVNA